LAFAVSLIWLNPALSSEVLRLDNRALGVACDCKEQVEDNGDDATVHADTDLMCS